MDTKTIDELLHWLLACEMKIQDLLEGGDRTGEVKVPVNYGLPVFNGLQAIADAWRLEGLCFKLNSVTDADTRTIEMSWLGAQWKRGNAKTLKR